jgi:hypothetical protein
MTRSDIDVIPLRRLNPSQHLELRKHAADGLVADGRGARLLVAEWKPSEEAVMPANQHVPDRSLEHLRVCARAAPLCYSRHATAHAIDQARIDAQSSAVLNVSPWATSVGPNCETHKRAADTSGTAQAHLAHRRPLRDRRS